MPVSLRQYADKREKKRRSHKRRNNIAFFMLEELAQICSCIISKIKIVYKINCVSFKKTNYDCFITNYYKLYNFLTCIRCKTISFGLRFCFLLLVTKKVAVFKFQIYILSLTFE